MAYTQEQLDALDEALAQGVRQVLWADHQVTFRNLDEMKELRARIVRELQHAEGARPARIFRTSVEKGVF